MGCKERAAGQAAGALQAPDKTSGLANRSALFRTHGVLPVHLPLSVCTQGVKEPFFPSSRPSCETLYATP